MMSEKQPAVSVINEDRAAAWAMIREAFDVGPNDFEAWLAQSIAAALAEARAASEDTKRMIDALREASQVFSRMDRIEWDEDSDWQRRHYDTAQSKVTAVLRDIDGGGG